MSGRINVKGVISAITYPGTGSEPVVTALLRVDRGTLLLSFLGRTDVHSFRIGSRMHVKGTLAEKQGFPTVFNPQYSVLQY
jgi:hypothetical protein